MRAATASAVNTRYLRAGMTVDVTADSAGTGGTATATFLPGATTYRGPVTITVGAQGSSVTGSTQVQIVAPP